jgi:small subunit ribosomal protein S17
MTGVVTSNKMTKALVVAVYNTAVHPKYHKRHKVRRKFKATCLDSSKFEVGQTVEIVSCRPISKTISFKVVE